MTDKLLPCPFCGGDAEQDYQRAFRHLSGGRLDHGAAIYCTSCNADMIMCRADHPELSDEQRMAVMVENWNRRAPAPQPNLSLTIGALQRAHVERQEEWCPDQKPDLSFRGNELGGECGEAQNVIKKLERERHGWRGSRDTVEHLAEELADVIHCAVLVAITAGIEIEPAVVAKFNSTSEKNGLSTFLATTEGSAE